MTRKIISILLILALMLSVFSCSKAKDEDEGPAEIEVIDKTAVEDDDIPELPNNNTNNNQNNNNNNNNQNTTPSDDDDDDQTPTTGDYTVTFEYGYGNKVATSKTSDKVKAPAVDNPGYTLVGWFNGDTQWDIDNDTVTSDITLTAKWELAKYTITYDLKGGTCTVTAPTSYDVETEVKVSDVPTNGSLVFVGWYYDSPQNAKPTLTIPKGTTGDLTVTALWEQKKLYIGTYEQDGDLNTKDEKLEWMVIDEKDGLSLVVTKYCIDVLPFHKSGTGATWATCSLRQWLNGDFFTKSLTATERAAVVQSTVKAAPGPFKENVNVGCIDSKDNVFILSYEEYHNYFTSNDARKCAGTPYVINMGYGHTNNIVTWWLRNNTTIYGACIAEQDGTALHTGYSQKLTSIAVRPAMWVDLSKLPQ